MTTPGLSELLPTHQFARDVFHHDSFHTTNNLQTEHIS